LALLGAYLLRFEGGTAHLEAQIGLFLPMALALKLSVFFLTGIHRVVWRYVSIRDMIRISKAVAVSSALLISLVLMTTRFRGVSRTVFILDFLLTLILVGGMRVLFRVFRESLELSPAQYDLPRTLIIGAGDAGELLLRELRQKRHPEFNVVGFVDDDKAKRGASIHGVPVLGSREELDTIVAERQVEQALIAMPRAPQAARDYYKSHLEGLGLSCTEVRVRSSVPSVLTFEGRGEDG
jgi:FlaA1/EpsC-like NDP-sugar epimerase